MIRQYILKFSCHICCDVNCLCIFVGRYLQYWCVKYLSAGMGWCIHMHKLKSWMEISVVCGSCQRLNQVVDCIYCAQIDCVVAKNNEAVETDGLAEPPICITQHPGFHTICLNHWVLQMAWYQCKQQYQDSYEGPSHKENRHIAYRQLASWCWGLLEKYKWFCRHVLWVAYQHTTHLQGSKKTSCLKDLTLQMRNCFNTV